MFQKKYVLVAACTATMLSVVATGYSGSLDTMQQNNNSNFYGAVNVGVMQSTFHVDNDLINGTLPPNISTEMNQQAFEGGVALGYLSPFKNNYLWGVELSAAGTTGSAYMQDSSTQISETASSRLNIDLDLIAGLKLSELSKTYIKIGPSTAYVEDTVRSPVGFDPVYTNSTQNKFMMGVNFGIGFSRLLNADTYVFTEYNYHHYPKVSFPNFGNYASTYNHGVELTNNTLSVGIGMYF